MRILLLTQCYEPEVAAAAVRARGLATQWTRLGHEVTVLTGFPNYPSGRRFEGVDYGNRVLERELRDGVEVVRAFNLFYRSGQTLRRVADGLSTLASHAAWGMLSERRWDVVVASSPHAWLLPAGILIGRSRGIPVVLDIRDHWPETVPGHRDHPLFWGAMGRMITWSYRRAAMVVGVSPSYEALARDHGLPPDRFHWIPNGLDEDRFPWPPDRDAWRRSLGLPADAFVVSFIGTLGTQMGIETLVDAARRLREMEPRIHVLLAGEGTSRAALEAMAGPDAPNITFMDPVPASEVHRLLGASDASVACLEDTPEHRERIPAKLWEILGYGLPLILVAGPGEAARLLEEEARAGLRVPPGSADALAEVLRDLAADPRRCARLGEAGRRCVLGSYTRARLAARYADVLAALLPDGAET
ncbi:MAG: glycosyltransferase family 4 protein [Pseudomonadota bacterium]